MLAGVECLASLLPFIYSVCVCRPASKAPAVLFYPTTAGFTTRSLATPGKAAMFSILPNGAAFNYKCSKQQKSFKKSTSAPKGSPIFFLSRIYLWLIARSGPGLERPHWPRAITGCDRDRQPAGWTDVSGPGRKSTGSAFFKHRNHVLSSSSTTRRDGIFKTRKGIKAKAGKGGDDEIDRNRTGRAVGFGGGAPIVPLTR